MYIRGKISNGPKPPSSIRDEPWNLSRFHDALYSRKSMINRICYSIVALLMEVQLLYLCTGGRSTSDRPSCLVPISWTDTLLCMQWKESQTPLANRAGQPGTPYLEGYRRIPSRRIVTSVNCKGSGRISNYKPQHWASRSGCIMLCIDARLQVSGLWDAATTPQAGKQAHSRANESCSWPSWCVASSQLVSIHITHTHKCLTAGSVGWSHLFGTVLYCTSELITRKQCLTISGLCYPARTSHDSEISPILS